MNSVGIRNQYQSEITNRTRLNAASVRVAEVIRTGSSTPRRAMRKPSPAMVARNSENDRLNPSVMSMSERLRAARQRELIVPRGVEERLFGFVRGLEPARDEAHQVHHRRHRGGPTPEFEEPQLPHGQALREGYCVPATGLRGSFSLRFAVCQMKTAATVAICFMSSTCTRS